MLSMDGGGEGGGVGDGWEEQTCQAFQVRADDEDIHTDTPTDTQTHLHTVHTGTHTYVHSYRRLIRQH
jgi:hypothetical protein